MGIFVRSDQWAFAISFRWIGYALIVLLCPLLISSAHPTSFASSSICIKRKGDFVESLSDISKFYRKRLVRRNGSLSIGYEGKYYELGRYNDDRFYIHASRYSQLESVDRDEFYLFSGLDKGSVTISKFKMSGNLIKEGKIALDLRDYFMMQIAGGIYRCLGDE